MHSGGRDRGHPLRRIGHDSGQYALWRVPANAAGTSTRLVAHTTSKKKGLQRRQTRQRRRAAAAKTAMARHHGGGSAAAAAAAPKGQQAQAAPARATGSAGYRVKAQTPPPGRKEQRTHRHTHAESPPRPSAPTREDVGRKWTTLGKRRVRVLPAWVPTTDPRPRLNPRYTVTL